MRSTIGRPLLALKLAMTLDGRIATSSGESRWITGPAARRATHALRSTFDAILVGGGTARQDDPDLTVRGMGPVPTPLRVVLTRSLSLPADSRLLRSAKDRPVWVIGSGDGGDDLRAAGIETLTIDATSDGLDLVAALRAVGDRGITRVLCEGGGQVAASLLRDGLVDELHLFQAGKIIGFEGRPGIGGLALSALADAPGFDLQAMRPIGDDTYSVWVRPMP